jgi:hypothetical protein
MKIVNRERKSAIEALSTSKIFKVFHGTLISSQTNLTFPFAVED